MERITPEPPRRLRGALMRQHWRDVIFVHWPADPEVVAPLLPAGTSPDIIGDVTYVGLVALRMCRVAPAGLPPLPYLSWFPEVNVRLYSVGADGRRGVTFLSLDAARLVPVLVGRGAVGLPYQWSRLRVNREGDTVRYQGRRLWPQHRGARLRLAVRVGEPVTSPTGLETFWTARWGAHTRRYGYLPAEHPRWPLYRATLLELAQDLIPAAGLPAVAGPPCSVLYSPGVAARLVPALTRAALALVPAPAG
jgi:uncharacterized protein